MSQWVYGSCGAKALSTGTPSSLVLVGSLSHPEHRPLMSYRHKVQLGKLALEVVFYLGSYCVLPSRSLYLSPAPQCHSLALALSTCMSSVVTLLSVMVSLLLLFSCYAWLSLMLFLHTRQYVRRDSFTCGAFHWLHVQIQGGPPTWASL